MDGCYVRYQMILLAEEPPLRRERTDRKKGGQALVNLNNGQLS